LFIEFDDIETMHIWDLGIYINFKIVVNLNACQIFIEEEEEEGRDLNGSELSEEGYIISER
jgi:hypothetical protein